MKRTFRRVLASMLAVLMIVCSIPFTASAAETNRKWWIDDGVDPATITEEPEFWGYNSPEDPEHQPYGPWYLTLGSDIDMLDDSAGAYEDHRDDYKPIMAITVSSQGENGMTAATITQSYYNKYYGSSAAQTYEAVKAAGLLLNPAELKAGQRIAISFEFGGVDTLNMGQFHGSYDMDYLKPAYYKSAPSRSDTWTATTSEGDALIKTGAAYYGEVLSFAGGADLIGNILVSAIGDCYTKGKYELSEFIGTGTNDPLGDGSGVRPFGQYGIYFGTLSFEVLQDCDLTDVLTFTENPVDAGNVFKIYDQSRMPDGKVCVTIDDRDCTFANCPVIWSEYSSGAVAECTHANLTKTEEVPATCLAAGTAAYWTCDDCGKMFSDENATTEITAPAELPILPHSYTGAIKSNGDGTHSYLCVNGCNQYGGTVDCTFGEMSIEKAPTITEEGIGRYTCGECGYYYDVVLDKVECTHENTEIRDAKEATCTEDGYTGDTWCLDCGEKIAIGTVIPAPGHTPVSANNAVDPTCTEDGKEADTVCSVCGEVLEVGAVIPAPGHTPGEPVETIIKEPTCTEKGYKNTTVTCTECGTILSSVDEELDELHHDFVEGETVPPT
ncbi:MAG: hypothetical protein ACI4RF_03490, partial [Eubacterium sp.]